MENRRKNFYYKNNNIKLLKNYDEIKRVFIVPKYSRYISRILTKFHTKILWILIIPYLITTYHTHNTL